MPDAEAAEAEDVAPLEAPAALAVMLETWDEPRMEEEPASTGPWARAGVREMRRGMSVWICILVALVDRLI